MLRCLFACSTLLRDLRSLEARRRGSGWKEAWLLPHRRKNGTNNARQQALCDGTVVRRDVARHYGLPEDVCTRATLILPSLLLKNNGLTDTVHCGHSLFCVCHERGSCEEGLLRRSFSI